MEKKDKKNSNKYKNISKSGNKIVNYLAKFKSRKLPKFRFENLFEFKKFEYAYTIKENNILTSNIGLVFT